MSNNNNNDESSEKIDLEYNLLANTTKMKENVDIEHIKNNETELVLNNIDLQNNISESENNKNNDNISVISNTTSKKSDKMDENTNNKNIKLDNDITSIYNDNYNDNNNKNVKNINNNEQVNESEIRKNKLEILEKLATLKKRGYIISSNYNMNSDYDMMKYEYELHRISIQKNNSIGNYGNILIGVLGCIEDFNSRYDPFGLDLEGWSTAVNNDIDSFYDTFVELHDKYKFMDNARPEIKLISNIVMSGIKFHATKKFLNKNKICDTNNIKQNINNNIEIIDKMNNIKNLQKKKQDSMMNNNYNGPHISDDVNGLLYDNDNISRKSNTKKKFNENNNIMIDEISLGRNVPNNKNNKNNKNSKKK
jgi:hypothetical protein